MTQEIDQSIQTMFQHLGLVEQFCKQQRYLASENETLRIKVNALQSELESIKQGQLEVQQQVNQANTKMEQQDRDLKTLQAEKQQLQDELASMKKVSLFANMNKQLHEKDQLIESLQTKLKNQEKKTITVVVPEVIVQPVTEEPVDEEEPEIEEEVTEDVEEEMVEEEEEPEIEYEAVKIGKKYYYVSNEESQGIYQINKSTNEVGDKVGEYNGDKPTFY